MAEIVLVSWKNQHIYFPPTECNTQLVNIWNHNISYLIVDGELCFLLFQMIDFVFVLKHTADHVFHPESQNKDAQMS